MARVFVSYSRRNIDFAKRLLGRLQEREMDFWVDWDGIAPTVDWMKEIEKGIEEADAFLAIVSPEWISSAVCKDELEIAVKNGKRLIPVVACDIVWKDVPPALGHLNFIFFSESFDFEQQLQKLFTALDTDYDWLKTHRRLQVKALEWERANKEDGFLLRGRDLEEAEQQISVNANKDPRPTDIQREYVLKSRQGATRQRRLTTGILMGLIAGMLGIIALLAWPYVQEAIARSEAQKLSRMGAVPAGNINFELEGPPQTIYVPAFSIETKPVSNEAYALCVNVDKCTPPIGSADFNDPTQADDPVVWVTIVQAAAYCEWIDRRLPSITEWERAASYFTRSHPRNNGFLLVTHYEWTSSYTEETSPGRIGEWNGQVSHLKIPDWYFLQEWGGVNPSEKLEMYTNTNGPFQANADLTFRCASDSP